jgi:hypothetical protein
VRNVVLGVSEAAPKPRAFSIAGCYAGLLLGAFAWMALVFLFGGGRYVHPDTWNGLTLAGLFVLPATLAALLGRIGRRWLP